MYETPEHFSWDGLIEFLFTMLFGFLFFAMNAYLTLQLFRWLEIV